MSTVVNDGTSDLENLAMVVMQHPEHLADRSSNSPHHKSKIRGAGGPLSFLQASFAADDHSSDPWTFHIK